MACFDNNNPDNSGKSTSINFPEQINYKHYFFIITVILTLILIKLLKG